MVQEVEYVVCDYSSNLKGTETPVDSYGRGISMASLTLLSVVCDQSIGIL
jgi:hypothetical protein